MDFWSAIVGGALTGTSTLGGQFLLARREDRRWERQRRLQVEEWQRQDKNLAFEYKRDAYIEVVTLHREWQQLVFDHLQNDRDLERRLARLYTLEAVEEEFDDLLDKYFQRSQETLAKVQLVAPEQVRTLAEKAMDAVFQYHYKNTPDGKGLNLSLDSAETSVRLLEEFIKESRIDLQSQSLNSMQERQS